MSTIRPARVVQWRSDETINEPVILDQPDPLPLYTWQEVQALLIADSPYNSHFGGVAYVHTKDKVAPKIRQYYARLFKGQLKVYMRSNFVDTDIIRVTPDSDYVRELGDADVFTKRVWTLWSDDIAPEPIKDDLQSLQRLTVSQLHRDLGDQLNARSIAARNTVQHDTD